MILVVSPIVGKYNPTGKPIMVFFYSSAQSQMLPSRLKEIFRCVIYPLIFRNNVPSLDNPRLSAYINIKWDQLKDILHRYKVGCCDPLAASNTRDCGWLHSGRAVLYLSDFLRPEGWPLYY